MPPDPKDTMARVAPAGQGPESARAALPESSTYTHTRTAPAGRRLERPSAKGDGQGQMAKIGFPLG